MTKPTRFYTEYVTRWCQDEPPETALVNAETLDAATAVYEAHLNDGPQIIERLNIRDATPVGEPIRGLIWDFEEEVVRDCP